MQKDQTDAEDRAVGETSKHKRSDNRESQIGQNQSYNQTLDVRISKAGPKLSGSSGQENAMPVTPQQQQQPKEDQ